ncbi:hypothetical protein EYF80_053572 [Liparis tanakae]|uniref:Secreted protein n=1 Tax=Liparis tanakae TaxID=230148 RepID=A0A4Z2F544_9TELE|nr:hypothetical protein EYF80_053572 [Liparis tanakae]
MAISKLLCRILLSVLIQSSISPSQSEASRCCCVGAQEQLEASVGRPSTRRYSCRVKHLQLHSERFQLLESKSERQEPVSLRLSLTKT